MIEVICMKHKTTNALKIIVFFSLIGILVLTTAMAVDVQPFWSKGQYSSYENLGYRFMDGEIIDTPGANGTSSETGISRYFELGLNVTVSASDCSSATADVYIRNKLLSHSNFTHGPVINKSITYGQYINFTSGLEAGSGDVYVVIITGGLLAPPGTSTKLTRYPSGTVSWDNLDCINNPTLGSSTAEQTTATGDLFCMHDWDKKLSAKLKVEGKAGSKINLTYVYNYFPTTTLDWPSSGVYPHIFFAFEPNMTFHHLYKNMNQRSFTKDVLGLNSDATLEIDAVCTNAVLNDANKLFPTKSINYVIGNFTVWESNFTNNATAWQQFYYPGLDYARSVESFTLPSGNLTCAGTDNVTLTVINYTKVGVHDPGIFHVKVPFTAQQTGGRMIMRATVSYGVTTSSMGLHMYNATNTTIYNKNWGAETGRTDEWIVLSGVMKNNFTFPLFPVSGVGATGSNQAVRLANFRILQWRPSPIQVTMYNPENNTEYSGEWDHGGNIPTTWRVGGCSGGDFLDTCIGKYEGVSNYTVIPVNESIASTFSGAIFSINTNLTQDIGATNITFTNGYSNNGTILSSFGRRATYGYTASIDLLNFKSLLNLTVFKTLLQADCDDIKVMNNSCNYQEADSIPYNILQCTDGSTVIRLNQDLEKGLNQFCVYMEDAGASANQSSLTYNTTYLTGYNVTTANSVSHASPTILTESTTTIFGGTNRTDTLDFANGTLYNDNTFDIEGEECLIPFNTTSTVKFTGKNVTYSIKNISQEEGGSGIGRYWYGQTFQAQATDVTEVTVGLWSYFPNEPVKLNISICGVNGSHFPDCTTYITSAEETITTTVPWQNVSIQYTGLTVGANYSIIMKAINATPNLLWGGYIPDTDYTPGLAFYNETGASVDYPLTTGWYHQSYPNDWGFIIYHNDTPQQTTDPVVYDVTTGTQASFSGPVPDNVALDSNASNLTLSRAEINTFRFKASGSGHAGLQLNSTGTCGSIGQELWNYDTGTVYSYAGEIHIGQNQTATGNGTVNNGANNYTYFVEGSGRGMYWLTYNPSSELNYTELANPRITSGDGEVASYTGSIPVLDSVSADSCNISLVSGANPFVYSKTGGDNGALLFYFYNATETSTLLPGSSDDFEFFTGETKECSTILYYSVNDDDYQVTIPENGWFDVWLECSTVNDPTFYESSRARVNITEVPSECIGVVCGLGYYLNFTLPNETWQCLACDACPAGQNYLFAEDCSNKDLLDGCLCYSTCTTDDDCEDYQECLNNLCTPLVGNPTGAYKAIFTTTLLNTSTGLKSPLEGATISLWYNKTTKIAEGNTSMDYLYFPNTVFWKERDFANKTLNISLAKFFLEPGDIEYMVQINSSVGNEQFIITPNNVIRRSDYSIPYKLYLGDWGAIYPRDYKVIKVEGIEHFVIQEVEFNEENCGGLGTFFFRDGEFGCFIEGECPFPFQMDFGTEGTEIRRVSSSGARAHESINSFTLTCAVAGQQACIDATNKADYGIETDILPFWHQCSPFSCQSLRVKTCPTGCSTDHTYCLDDWERLKAAPTGDVYSDNAVVSWALNNITFLVTMAILFGIGLWFADISITLAVVFIFFGMLILLQVAFPEVLSELTGFMFWLIVFMIGAWVLVKTALLAGGA